MEASHEKRSNHDVPQWMVTEKISLAEKLELRLYQLISVFPVLVTFGLYTYLLVFYCLVSTFYDDDQCRCSYTRVLSAASN